jgi:hypothetical protein
VSAEALKDFAKQHETALFEAAALLAAVAGRLDAAVDADYGRNPEVEENWRLVKMAHEKVAAAARGLLLAAG